MLKHQCGHPHKFQTFFVVALCLTAVDTVLSWIVWEHCCFDRSSLSHCQVLSFWFSWFRYQRPSLLKNWWFGYSTITLRFHELVSCQGKGFNAVAKNCHSQPFVTGLLLRYPFRASVGMCFSNMLPVCCRSIQMEVWGEAIFPTCCTLGTNNLTLFGLTQCLQAIVIPLGLIQCSFCPRNYYKLLHHGSARIEDADVRICSDVRRRALWMEKNL